MTTAESQLTPAGSSTPPEPTILPCNFRSAGRLSNDSLRQLRTMHDSFARNVSHALDLFLGSPIELKLLGVEQIGSRDFVAGLAPGSYLVPFALLPLGNRAVARFDSTLLFPLLDLLLGGSGEPMEMDRELTEIDEELIRSVTDLMAAQLERSWKACQVSVAASPSIKPALVGQLFVAEERSVALNFELSLVRSSGSLRLILPMSFCNALVRSAHPEGVRLLNTAGAVLPLRERVLECEMLVSVELPGIGISVGELIALQPGSVLNLNTPVDSAVQLNILSHPLFEVTPVRSGGRKTAQLDRPCPTIRPTIPGGMQ